METLETSISRLELRATSDLFPKGKLIQLTCEATQFSLYKDRVTQPLSEDAPQIASVLGPQISCGNLIGT